MMNMQKWPLLSAVLLASLALAGCSVAPSTAFAPAQGRALQGRVFGGQQPVAFATVQLYAAGSSGYGSASTALITATSAGSAYPVTTNASGIFNITGDFTCPTPSSTPVYLVVTGGYPTSQPNPNLALMAALGPCSGLPSIPFVNVNEITTVASVWALSPFMTAIDHVGTSSTNALGLSNAFAAVNKMVNIATGTVSGPALPAGATLPTDELNGLGDILAACVNSSGGSDNDGSNCGTLFHNAKPGSTAPTDTVTAAMNIAQNPSLNVTPLFNLIASAGSVFVTNLTLPNAWTIAINYTGGGLNKPSGIANDSNGNVWLPNAGNNSVTELSSTGAAQSGSSGYTAGPMNAPAAIAIDTSGNAWVANSGNASITKLNSTGTTGTIYNGNGLSMPNSIAFDKAGDIWVVNAGSVSAFTSSGGAIGNFNGGAISAPVSIAIDPQ
jgi:hypothetical protein